MLVVNTGFNIRTTRDTTIRWALALMYSLSTSSIIQVSESLGSEIASFGLVNPRNPDLRNVRLSHQAYHFFGTLEGGMMPFMRTYSTICPK